MERTSLKLAGAKLILITGGARSGKSAFAEKYAAQAAGKDGKVAYIATAQVYDEEMKFRVQRHRARRPENWQTFEAPTEEDVLAALQQAGETCDVILFDCGFRLILNVTEGTSSAPEINRTRAVFPVN